MEKGGGRGTRLDNEGDGGGGWEGRDGDHDMTPEEARPVRLAVRSRYGGTGADYYHHCGSQVEKILMSGRMRIAKNFKNFFIVASTVSFDPSQKSLLILITTLILTPSLKTRRY